MRKLQHIVLSFCLILSLFFYPSVEADASSVSLGVSASTVNIGDKVKVTISVPENISATIDLTFSSDILSFSKASADVGVNGSTITLNVGKYSLAASNKLTVTFKAKTSGTASISASVVSAVDNDTAEEVSLGGASTSVTVENAETNPEEKPEDNPEETPDNTPPEETTPEGPKSKDNSLKNLKLSSGTLSPSFKYNVTKYTATVGYNVTSVVVSATPSNEKATIVSVTGDGNVNLAVGKNTIQIVVQAENGVKATYTIVVTREEQGEDQEDVPADETDPDSEETPQSDKELGLEWNGQKLQPGTDISDDLVPADFSKDTIVINSIEVPCIRFANADLMALYLINADETAGFYVYDEEQQSIYPFVKLETGNSYVIVLPPDEENVPVPENYKPCTLSIEGKGVVNAYQFIEPVKDTEATSWFAPETFYAAPATASDFYLLYGMNSVGEKNWYVYDSVERTVQRYFDSAQSPAIETEPETESNTENTETTENTEEYNALAAKLKAAENEQMIIICIAVFIVAVLVIIIVNLILRGRDEEPFEEEEFEEEFENEESEDEDDFDNEYDSEGEEYTKDEKNHLQQDSGVIEDDDEIEIEFYEMPQEEHLVEDDEIEIEFYEMTEASSEEATKESNEVEVEFYEMEDLLMKEAIASNPLKIQTVVDEDDGDLEFIELD